MAAAVIAVDIEVAEDGDRLARPRRRSQEGHGLIDVGEGEGIALAASALEEGARRVRGADAAVLEEALYQGRIAGSPERSRQGILSKPPATLRLHFRALMTAGSSGSRSPATAPASPTDSRTRSPAAPWR